jgi:hypothetical protein
VFRQAIIRNLILQLMAATDKLLVLHAADDLQSGGGGVAGRSVWRD